jgi:hypothetical protein
VLRVRYIHFCFLELSDIVFLNIFCPQLVQSTDEEPRRDGGMTVYGGE